MTAPDIAGVSSASGPGAPLISVAERILAVANSTGDVRRDAISPPPGDRWATAAALTETV